MTVLASWPVTKYYSTKVKRKKNYIFYFFFFKLIPKSGKDLSSSQDVRVTGISDSQNTNSEQFTTSGTQFVVTTLEVRDLSLGQHGVVFNFSFSQDWSVSSQNNQLSLTLSQGFDTGFVTKLVFTRFDGKSQLRVKRILGFSWGL